VFAKSREGQFLASLVRVEAPAYDALAGAAFVPRRRLPRRRPARARARGSERRTLAAAVGAGRRRGRALDAAPWNQACVGNELVDVAFWLPSLHDEGGPAPDEVLPDCPPELAGTIAGFFAARAGLPPPATAPRVRPLQLAQLRVALPWAARALGLPEPG